MSIIPLINPKVQKKNRRGRGPGKSNIKGICACYLADLIQGTANDWATSPKRIIEGIGAPVSHEYLRKALKLSAADRWGVELGLSSLVSACTTNTPTRGRGRVLSWGAPKANPSKNYLPRSSFVAD